MISPELRLDLENKYGIFTRSEEELKIMNESLKTLNSQIKALKEKRDIISKDKDKLINTCKEQMIDLQKKVLKEKGKSDPIQEE